MTQEEVIEKAKAILTDEFEIEETKIHPESLLKEELGLDSLDTVDVVVVVEQIFGLLLNSKDFIGVKTFEDFYKMIYKKINE